MGVVTDVALDPGARRRSNTLTLTSEVEANVVVLSLLVDTCGKKGEPFFASSTECNEFTRVIDPEQVDPNDRCNVEHVADTTRGVSALDGRQSFPGNPCSAGEMFGRHPSRNACHPYLLP
ncbi:hypothetical protein OSR35_20890 [Paenarthrobacter ureafaciens]|nr:hypothetical protein [Paenarthrobacter ureafaciens]MCX8456574.1 hypothetical protein [Paenarthrobacter ureafaciens]MCY0974208.1 hypothetical protein [Paenarthrobacter ureafaciens]